MQNNESHTPDVSRLTSNVNDDEINLLDYLIVLLKRKKLISGSKDRFVFKQKV